MTSIRHLILSAVVFVAMTAFADQANTRLSTFNECATLDARFMLQLEQHGDQASMPGDRLYPAYLTMLRARAACSAGRWQEGLALYDGPFGPVRNNLIPSICSERHLQALGLIEELGEVSEVAGQTLFEALIAALHAHNVCAERRPYEAIAIYDAIALGLPRTRSAR